MGDNQLHQVLSQLGEIKGTLNSLSTNKPSLREIYIPLLSLIVALAGVLSGVYIHHRATKTQINIKQIEVTFIAKQKGYASIMSNIHDTFAAAAVSNKAEMIRSIETLRTSFWEIEPFVDSKNEKSCAIT